MKLKNNFFALILIASVVFFSCKKEDRITPKTTNSLITEGDWKVTSFNDDGKDETYHFNGYTFKFKEGGTVSTTRSNLTTNGNWWAGGDDSHVKLHISFPSAPLNELNEDWRVLDQSSGTIELEHVSGGNGGTDHLKLQRI